MAAGTGYSTPRLQLELGNPSLQLFGQLAQGEAGGGRLLGATGHLVGRLMDHRYVAVQILGHRVLLLGGGGNLGVHVRDQRHRFGEVS